MSQLKPSFVKEILARLSDGGFTRDDFDVDLPDTGNLLLRIKFLHRPGYQFSVTEETRIKNLKTEFGSFTQMAQTSKESHTVYRVHMSPGKYKTLSNEDVDSLGELKDLIRPWSDGIRADLYALAPSIDPVQQLREQLSQKIDEFVQEPEKYFSEEQISTLERRLDDLLKELQGLQEEHGLTKQQLETVAKDFAEFKSSARVYPQGMWAKITTNRFSKTIAGMVNSPEGRKMIFDQVKRLFGPD